MSDPGFGLLLLGRGFEEKLGHFSHGQTLGQVIRKVRVYRLHGDSGSSSCRTPRSARQRRRGAGRVGF